MLQALQPLLLLLRSPQHISSLLLSNLWTMRTQYMCPFCCWIAGQRLAQKEIYFTDTGSCPSRAKLGSPPAFFSGFLRTFTSK